MEAFCIYFDYERETTFVTLVRNGNTAVACPDGAVSLSDHGLHDRCMMLFKVSKGAHNHGQPTIAEGDPLSFQGHKYIPSNLWDPLTTIDCAAFECKLATR